jgi:hypothetical protein
MTELTTPSKDLLARAEFCARYGVGNTKFYELLNSGALRALKLGTRTYVDVSEAERWKASLPTYQPSNRAR